MAISLAHCKEDIKIRDKVTDKTVKVTGETKMSLNGLQVNGIVMFEILKKIVARDSNGGRELIFPAKDGEITISDMEKMITEKLSLPRD